MPKGTDYDGLAPWEVGLPQLEEYADGWMGCSICLAQWTHKLDGYAIAVEWGRHLLRHARGEQ